MIKIEFYHILLILMPKVINLYFIEKNTLKFFLELNVRFLFVKKKKKKKIFLKI